MPKELFMRVSRFLLLSSIAGLFLVCGCESLLTPDPYIQVKPAQLNRLEIVYRPGPDLAVTRLNISGSGIVEIETGRSPQVANGFAQETKDRAWHDVHRTQQVIAGEDAVMIFQTLVNLGLLKKPEDPPKDAPPPVATAMVIGNLDGRMISRPVIEPDLLAEIASLSKLFTRQSRSR